MIKDAFGIPLEYYDSVVFVGRDHKDKPTLNKGFIDEIDVGRDRVRVVRLARSGVNGVEIKRRPVWVEVRKVAKQGVLPDD